MPALPRQNNPAELRAFEDSCARLSGFDGRLDFEWVDGFLTAIAAGPGVPPTEEWLAALCDDAFDRVFADPQDRAQALRALKTRLTVLLDQLDAEWLLDQPGALRLAPLMAEWRDDERQRLHESGEVSAEEAATLHTGWRWAEGVAAGAAAFPTLWAAPGAGADDERTESFRLLWETVQALQWPADSPQAEAHRARFHADAEPDRDRLIDEACFALQELRLWWVDEAAPPATRRVAPVPGRNDPCPCGSGRKFKKCHGAASA